jgi:uncharacterized protein YndB with AHSA1/START domain/predicted enzyme related to lactoylglutathione lyase
MIDLTLAQTRVTSMDAAETWYTRVFGTGPDTRPMDGLLEWRFGVHHGVQVFLDPDHAGSCAVVLGVSDLDRELTRLDAAGVDHGGEQPGGGGRLLILTDPDGNHVVLTDPWAAHGAAHGDVAQTTLRFQRTLSADIDRVWEAYADVDQRRRWSAPEGDVVEYDAHTFAVDGVDSYRCGPPGALDNHGTTRYLGIDPPGSLVFTHEVRRDGRPIAVDTTSWRLDVEGEATRVTLDVQVTALAGDGVLEGYREGHERTLDRLERFLS